MDVLITPCDLGGKIKPPASKSQAHRLLICAAFSDKPTIIKCPEISDDISATADCLSALGADITYKDGKYYVNPIKSPVHGSTLNCLESGSTLRFLISVVSALGTDSTFLMSGRLPKRPLSPLAEQLQLHGISLIRPTDNTLVVGGKLCGGSINLKANVSSQFLSGLMFAMPLTDEKLCVTLSGDIVSEDYINMTVSAMKQFGVQIEEKGNTYSAHGKGYISSGFYEAEPDWSNAAFWLCAEKLSKKSIDVYGLNFDSPQGDKRICSLLDNLKEKSIIDAENIPDLIPVLCVVASLMTKETVITNAARLRLKESDRLKSTADMINSLGGNASVTDDGLIIKGVSHFSGGTVNSYGDHRIAMSAAVASICSSGDVIISGAEAVNKSYPAFWDDFEKLGGKIIRRNI